MLKLPVWEEISPSWSTLTFFNSFNFNLIILKFTVRVVGEVDHLFNFFQREIWIFEW